MTVAKVFSSIAVLSLLLAAFACSMIRKNPSDFTLKVDAQSNVFAAGPGGLDANGGGKAPPSAAFTPGAGMVLTFSNVSGKVSCCGGGESFNDADGGTFAGGVTDVESAGGISGMTNPNKTMFLVGVFLDDKAPKPPGPARLNADDPKNLTPQLYQTFFIGTGKGKQFAVPATATKLVLGFVDGFSFSGAPGSYDDNVGELSVAFNISASAKTK